MKRETDAERTARKTKARDFREDHAGRGAKQEFFRTVAERNSGADQIGHPPSGGRRKRSKGLHIGNLVSASTDFGKFLLVESRKIADVPIQNRSVGEPLAGLDVSGLPAVVDASVLLHSDIARPSLAACTDVVKLIEAGQVNLCVTSAIINEISGLAKINGPQNLKVELADTTINSRGRQRLERILNLAEDFNTRQRFGALPDHYVDCLEDPNDVMYLIARYKFERWLRRPVVLVSRDHHLLDLEDRNTPTADRRILHPIAFIEQCLALGILGQNQEDV